MPTLKAALKAGDLPPKAHLVHLALCDLGEGIYTAKDVAVALGYPLRGKYLTRVITGAKQLRAHKYISHATGEHIEAGPAYAKQKRGAKDAA